MNRLFVVLFCITLGTLYPCFAMHRTSRMLIRSAIATVQTRTATTIIPTREITQPNQRSTPIIREYAKTLGSLNDQAVSWRLPYADLQQILDTGIALFAATAPDTQEYRLVIYYLQQENCTQQQVLQKICFLHSLFANSNNMVSDNTQVQQFSRAIRLIHETVVATTPSLGNLAGC
ncbi:hypothetical protein M1466_03830 [Candidatus Dependentiae bacterium]|nr:hypothetical protein [Candidatus Dependentiae bacterium]